MITQVLVCAATIVLNTSDKPWNADDQKSYEFNKRRNSCRVNYPISNPCMKKFIKVREKSYHIICGPKEEK